MNEVENRFMALRDMIGHKNTKFRYFRNSEPYSIAESSILVTNNGYRLLLQTYSFLFIECYSCCLDGNDVNLPRGLVKQLIKEAKVSMRNRNLKDLQGKFKSLKLHLNRSASK